MANTIPDIVIGRLPLYLRALTRLEQAGVAVTSSHELGQQLEISSAQIRKDLSHFGEFGKQGTGYQVAYLREQLARILQIDCEWPVAVVGAGNLGQALVQYKGFEPRGFRIVAIFDNNPALIGQAFNTLKVQASKTMTGVLQQEQIKIAMLAVPASVAQDVTDELIDAGVRAILNYAPIKLSVPPHIHVQDIDPVIHLQHMTFYLREDE